MEFAMTAGDIARSMKSIKGTIPARSTVPILQFALVTAKDGRVGFQGSCADMEARSLDTAEVIRNGSMAIHADTLLSLVSKLPKGALVTVAEANGDAAIVSGRSRYRLQTLPADDFPAMGDHDDGVSFSMDAKALSGILSATIGTVATEDTRPHLCGVYLHIKGEKLLAVSVDGHRLTRAEADAPSGSKGMPSVIVPTAAAREIISICDATDGAINVTVSEVRISASAVGIVFSSRLINAEFPDYSRVIPQTKVVAMTVSASDLVDAVDRASTVYTGLATRSMNAVELRRADGALTLAAGPGGQDLATEIVDAILGADPGKTSISSRYLIDAAKPFGSAQIEISYGGPGDPVMITSPDRPDLTSVIMPCKR